MGQVIVVEFSLGDAYANYEYDFETRALRSTSPDMQRMTLDAKPNRC